MKQHKDVTVQELMDSVDVLESLLQDITYELEELQEDDALELDQGRANRLHKRVCDVYWPVHTHFQSLIKEVQKAEPKSDFDRFEAALNQILHDEEDGDILVDYQVQ